MGARGERGRRRKIVSDVLRRSAATRSLENRGEGTTRGRNARRGGRRGREELTEVFEETARGTIIRIALAAILYVVGAAGVIYVAIREGGVPGSVVNYWPLLVCAMTLVVVAALLLPVPRGSEAPNGGAEADEEEEAESGV